MKKYSIITYLLLYITFCVFLNVIINNNEHKEKSNLFHTSVIFSGDSITTGTHNKNVGWAEILNRQFQFKQYEKVSVPGATLGVHPHKNQLYTQIKNTNKNYDYVILQGGINDIQYSVDLGVISNSYCVKDFDSTTTIGGLETYLYYATKNFPDSKIGFIINYPTPMLSQKLRKNISLNGYYILIRKICEKWGISVLDLSNSISSNYNNLKYSSFQMKSSYFDDEIHPNKYGYKELTKIIKQWMEELPNYQNRRIKLQYSKCR